MNTKCITYIIENLINYYLTNFQWYMLTVLVILEIKYDIPLFYVLMLMIFLEISTFGIKWRVAHKDDPNNIDVKIINEITYWIMVILFTFSNIAQIIISSFLIVNDVNVYITIVSWVVIARSIITILLYSALLCILKMIPDFNKISRVYK